VGGTRIDHWSAAGYTGGTATLSHTLTVEGAER
jgi:hypothetical protein